MTSERLMMVEPSEIRGLRLTCQKCQASLSLRVDQTIALPPHCPGCGNEWKDNEGFKTNVKKTAETFELVVHALKTWLRTERESKPPFRVGFELLDDSRR